MGDDRLKCTEEQLIHALTGNVQAMQQELLALYLQQLRLVDEQMEKLNGMIAEALKKHQDAVVRLAGVPGFGPDSARQVIAEVGVQSRRIGGGRGIRTPDPATRDNGFQDRRFQPLTHPSDASSVTRRPTPKR